MSADPKKKLRSIFYKRAIWFNSSDDKSLYYYLSLAHKRLCFSDMRTFPYHEGEIQGTQFKDTGSKIFFQVASYIPDQSASLVPKPSKDPQSQIDTTPPPDGNNFMVGDIFFMVEGDHIIIMPSNVNEGVASSYIKQTLSKVGFDNIVPNLNLEKIAKADKAQLLDTEGVKKITLGTSLYEASAEHIKKKKKTLFLDGLVRDFLDLFSVEGDKELQELDEKENLNVKIEISFDGRRKGGEISRKRLDRAADIILGEADEDDKNGFTIETRSGKKITHDELRVGTKEYVEVFGNSVDRRDVWSKLDDFLEELKSNGMLEL